VKCTDLSYGAGFISLGELIIPFSVEKSIELAINKVQPKLMLKGYSSYVFSVQG